MSQQVTDPFIWEGEEWTFLGAAREREKLANRVSHRSKTFELEFEEGRLLYSKDTSGTYFGF